MRTEAPATRPERHGKRPLVILVVLCVVAAGLATAASSAAGAASVALQAQQTDWYVNDDPTFYGTWVRGDLVSSGNGYGSSRYHGSNYAYTAATDGRDPAGSYAEWDMGTRVGTQEIQVYIPGNHATARVQYQINTISGSTTTTNQPDRVNQADLFGWHTLEDPSGSSWDTDGLQVKIAVHYDSSQPATGRTGAAWRSVGADAVRMRCVANCGSTPAPAVPRGLQSGPGRKWDPVRRATVYDVAVSDGSTTDVGRAGCCGENLFFSRDAVRFRVRALDSSGRTSDWSAWVDIIRVPAVPSGLRHRSGSAVWNAVPGATSYDVIVWADFEGVTTNGVQCCSFSLPGDAESFSVRAVNSAGRSDWARSVTVERPVEVPTVPSGLRFSSGQAVWNAVSGTTSYDVRTMPQNVVTRGLSCCSYTLPTDTDRFSVRAVNSDGASLWSNFVDVPNVVDPPTCQTDSDFVDPRLHGPSQHWYSGLSGKGHGSNNFRFTYATGNDRDATNWAVWDMGNICDGDFQLQVYIPHVQATADVQYHIYQDDTRLRTVRLSQNDSYGWTVLASRIRLHGRVTLRLNDHDAVQDARSDGYGSSRIGADAMWLGSYDGGEPIDQLRFSRPRQLTDVSYSDGQAVWDAVKAASYDVQLFVDATQGALIYTDVDCCTYPINDTGITQFRVRAVNRAGAGEWSSRVTVPVGNPGLPRNLTATAQDHQSIRVTWSPPADTGGSPIARYDIQYSRSAIRNHPVYGNQDQWTSSVLPVSGTSHFQPNLKSGVTYTVSVRAINDRGRLGVLATTTVATPRNTNVPSVPRNLQVDAQDHKNVTVTWSPPSDTGGSPISRYEVRYSREALRNHSRHDDDDAWKSKLRRRYGTEHVRELKSDVTYTVEVRAVNQDGSASPFTRTSFTTGSAPNDPPSTAPTQSNCPTSSTGKKFETRRSGGTNVLWIATVAQSTRVHALTEFTATVHEGSSNGFWGATEIEIKKDGLNGTGGKVKSSLNLSQTGCSWVFFNAVVNNSGARVLEDAVVYGSAIVGGDRGSATVRGDAKVYGNAIVAGDAEVYGNAQVYGSARVVDATVRGDAKVYENAQVSGSAIVEGDAEIFGDMVITSGIFDGEREYKGAARATYNSLYNTLLERLKNCPDLNADSEDLDRYVRHYIRYGEAGAEGISSYAIFFNCLRLTFVESAIQQFAGGGWSFGLSVALALVGSLKLVGYTAILIKLAADAKDIHDLANAGEFLDEEFSKLQEGP